MAIKYRMIALRVGLLNNLQAILSERSGVNGSSAFGGTLIDGGCVLVACVVAAVRHSGTA